MNKNKDLQDSIKNFKDIIINNWLYVDKTAYLANMIADGAKTWFLARPSRFGKSLIVSTFLSLFSGEKELFQGLAIEKWLGHDNFAPRPVIHLDMSEATIYSGPERFIKSLSELTYKAALNHGLDITKDHPPENQFQILIKDCSKKYGQKVAVLIDEYDYPIRMPVNEKPKDEEFRRSLLEYYNALNDLGDYVSFVFVTGVSKSAQDGVYSAFENFRDISLETQYAALTGFTHGEIEKYFYGYIDEAAKSHNISRETLLEEMRNYYNGFCFDGETMVYNPYSVLLFFQTNKFKNFWFKKLRYIDLIYFMNEKRMTSNRFQGVEVDKDEIQNPNINGDENIKTYLYQLGYLSLRPGESAEKYVLDYSNLEVKQSIRVLLRGSYFESSEMYSQMEDIKRNIQIAILAGDPSSLIYYLNILLNEIPGDDCGLAWRSHGYYNEILFMLFRYINLEFYYEVHRSRGSLDFVITCGGKTAILEIKINRSNTNELKQAREAMEQMKSKGYALSYDDPLSVGLVINDQARSITAWTSLGGTPSRR
jgi:hypothetical protein